jgi:hypothetical protein
LTFQGAVSDAGSGPPSVSDAAFQETQRFRDATFQGA